MSPPSLPLVSCLCPFLPPRSEAACDAIHASGAGQFNLASTVRDRRNIILSLFVRMPRPRRNSIILCGMSTRRMPRPFRLLCCTILRHLRMQPPYLRMLPPWPYLHRNFNNMCLHRECSSLHSMCLHRPCRCRSILCLHHPCPYSESCPGCRAQLRSTIPKIHTTTSTGWKDTTAWKHTTISPQIMNT